MSRQRVAPAMREVTIEHYGAAVEASGNGNVGAARLAAFVRKNNDQRPYSVVNDYVSSALGWAIGACTPPGGLMQSRAGSVYYASMGFTPHGGAPPPADLEQFARDMPFEASFVVALDFWVHNADRHDDNMAYVPKFGAAAFDFDAALFGFNPTDPIDVLEKTFNVPVISHPIAPHLGTSAHLRAAVIRASSVSTYEIASIANRAMDAGLIRAAERTMLVDFLLHRQSHLGDLLAKRREDFKASADWFGEGGDDE